MAMLTPSFLDKGKLLKGTFFEGLGSSVEDEHGHPSGDFDWMLLAGNSHPSDPQSDHSTSQSRADRVVAAWSFWRLSKEFKESFCLYSCMIFFVFGSECSDCPE